MPPVIVAEQLTKWYGPRLAVDHVSLEVESGEVMGLLGPNGSGKTTILRILTGYLRPSDGTARVAGFDVSAESRQARARVGYVPEDVPLYGWMRVREFLGFMARLKNVPPADVERTVNAAIDRLALGDVRHLLIARLSRGYRQRVAIAQALLGNPDVLVLDEPTNGLDPHQIIEMRGHIRALAGERAVLVTSHVLSEMERVADRVAVLVGGRLLGVHTLRANGAGQRLRLTVRGETRGVLACVAAVPGVLSVAPEPSAPGGGDGEPGGTDGQAGVTDYAVDTEGGPVAERVAASLVKAGFGLLHLGPAAAQLEALFLRLTEGNGGARR